VQVAELVAGGAQNWRWKPRAIEALPCGILNGVNAPGTGRIRDSRIQPSRALTGAIDLLARLKSQKGR